MSDRPNIPWATVGTVLVVLGGIYLYLKPAESQRPRMTAQVPQDLAPELDVEARLWQDPLEAVARHDPDKSRSTSDPLHTLEFLRSRVAAVRSAAGGKVLVLAVLIPGGPYSDDAETRLRTRHAVLSALGVSGFIPTDSFHIGSLNVRWEPQFDEVPADAAAALSLQPFPGEANPPVLSIPYEWCSARPVLASAAFAANAEARLGSKVLVLWLQEDALVNQPLQRLRLLRNALAQKSPLQWLQKAVLSTPQPGPQDQRAPDFDFRVVGPRSSTLLKAMIEAVPTSAARMPGHAMNASPATVPAVPLYSGTATLDDAALTYGTASDKAVSELLKESGFQFHRTTPTEIALAGELIDELERRQVNVSVAKQRRQRHASAQQRPPRAPPDNVALVGEWDTLYGRAIGFAFLAALQGRTVADVLKDEPVRWPAHVSRHSYLRGIDGQLPGDATVSSGSPAPSPKSQLASVVSPGFGPEATEGRNQSDYLRRLALELEQEDRRLKIQGGMGLKAVGIFGSDVYDKLLVLQVLRQRLPNVLFFTTDVDVRFFHPDAWHHAHNLLIVSHFGLQTRLGSDHWDALAQNRVPPFRDGYQTATYCAALAALGNVPQNGLELATLRPRIFEVGRAGPVDLSLPPSNEHPYRSRALAQRPDQLHWWSARRVLQGYTVLLAGAVLLLYLVAMSGVTGFKWRNFLLHHYLFIPIALFCVAAALAKLKGNLEAGEEPVLLLQGVSVWGTEAIRVFAALLSVHFVLRAWHDMRQNRKEIEDRFDLAPRRNGAAWWVKWQAYRCRRELIGTLRVPPWELTFWAAAAGCCGQQGACPWPEGRVECFARRRRTLRRICYRAFPQIAFDWDHRGEAIAAVAGFFASRQMEGARPPGRRALTQRREADRRRRRRWLHVCSWWNAVANRWPRVQENRPSDARQLWRRYRECGTPLARLLRFGPAVVLYGIFGFTMIALLGPPRAPVRGAFTAQADRVALMVSVAGLIFLTFFVADATRLCQRFIDQLCRKTAWPRSTLVRASSKLALPADDLDEYLDIELIARLTNVVGRVIYYPFIVMTLLILSRNSYFDDWDWPLSLLIIFSLNALYAIAAGVVMRRAAERARREDLRPLREKLISYQDSAPNRHRAERIERIIKSIEANRTGAFGSFSHNPVLGAFLLPSSGIGAWALLEVLAKWHAGG